MAGAGSWFNFLGERAVAHRAGRSLDAHHLAASVADLDHTAALILVRLDETHGDGAFALEERLA